MTQSIKIIQTVIPGRNSVINKMFSTRTSYFMKNPEIFVLSLICIRANIFLLRFKTLPVSNCRKKPQHRDKCKFNCVRLNLIWYFFILDLEIRAWNLYFLKSMKTSFTWITKINPVSWRELLIFCRQKLQGFCLSIRKLVRLPLRKYHVPTNWQPCWCSDKFLRCFVFAIWIGSYVYVVVKN